SYLTAGSALLADDGWQRRHDLLFELERHRAESEFLNGDNASAEQRLTMLSSRATTVIERCAVASLAADVSWAVQRPDRGLAECLECLGETGLRISRQPTRTEAEAAYEQICSRLDGVDIDQLAELPVLADPTSREIMSVIMKVALTAIVTD